MKHYFFLGWLIVTHLAVWSGWQMMKLKTEYSVDQFYPASHPLLVHHEKIRNEFRLHEEQPFLFVIQYPREESWVEPGKISRLKKLSREIEETPGVAAITSLTHVEGASHEREELVVGSLFDRVPPQNWKLAVENNPLLYPLLVTADFRSTLIVVEAKQKSRSELHELEKKIRSNIAQVFPDAEILSAGVPVLQARLSSIIQEELFRFLLYTATAFCLVFLFLFGHPSAVGAALFILVATNGFALALMSAFSIPMNAILVTLPVIVSVSIMSLLIHTLHLWAGRSSGLAGDARRREAWLTMKELSLPNALGILTTALGFLALSPSPIPLISQYGWTVALVLSFVAIFAQLLMLLFLPLISGRLRQIFEGPARWALIPIRHPRWILGITVVVFVLGTLEIGNLNFSLRLFNDLPENDDVRKSTDWIDSRFGGILAYEISVRSSEEGFWKKPANLERLKKLGEDIRRVPGVRAVISISDFFQGRIPADSNSVAETYFLFFFHGEQGSSLAFPRRRGAVGEDLRETRRSSESRGRKDKNYDPQPDQVISSRNGSL